MYYMTLVSVPWTVCVILGVKAKTKSARCTAHSLYRFFIRSLYSIDNQCVKSKYWRKGMKLKFAVVRSSLWRYIKVVLNSYCAMAQAVTRFSEQRPEFSLRGVPVFMVDSMALGRFQCTHWFSHANYRSCAS